MKLKQHIIIGLAGRHGSGKSTIASYVKNLLQDYSVEIIVFSTCIKELLANATGGSIEVIESLKNTNTLTRFLMEKIGAEYIKDETKYGYIVEQIRLINNPSFIIIDGVRTIADVDFLRTHYDAIIIMISRDIISDDKKNYIPKPEPLLTELELTKLKVDYRFDNDSMNFIRLLSDLRHLLFNEIMNNTKIKSKHVYT